MAWTVALGWVVLPHMSHPLLETIAAEVEMVVEAKKIIKIMEEVATRIAADLPCSTETTLFARATAIAAPGQRTGPPEIFRGRP